MSKSFSKRTQISNENFKLLKRYPIERQTKTHSSFKNEGLGDIAYKMNIDTKKSNVGSQ